MSARDELLADLYAERYNHPLWWEKPAPEIKPDGELICAQRRRDAVADLDRLNYRLHRSTA